jgi:hypothetical protein
MAMRGLPISDSEPTSLCSFSLMLHAKQSQRSNKYQLYSLWFDPTWARTHNLPHSNHYALILYLFNEDCQQPMAMRGLPIKRLYNKKYYKLGTIIYTFNMCWYLFQTYNRNGVMVSVLASSGVDCGFEHDS